MVNRYKNILFALTAFLIVSSMGVLMLQAVRNDSPTSDEPPHILSGYAFLKYGIDYIDAEHPLFAKSLASIPLLFQNIKFDKESPLYTSHDVEFNVGKMFTYSRNFLDFSGNNPDSILFSTRITMILLTVFFGVIVFLFTTKLFGKGAALLATFLYATEPNILAHGGLVNTDLAATGFILLSIYALYLYFERQSRNRLFFLIFSLALAFLSKHSTFILFPLILIFMEILYHTQKYRPRIHLLAVFLGVFAIIFLFYGIISLRTRGISGFFPYEYFKGLILIPYSLGHDLRFSYLLGESYFGGRWYYFPILILAKTQLWTLVLFLISIATIAFRKFKLSKKQLLLLLVPPAAYLAVAMISSFNIGVRHVLPIYPFMIILGAGGFFAISRLVFKNFSKQGSFAIVGLALLIIVVSRIWSVAITYPSFLSYYNVAFGGTAAGWKVSDDSNYDWGQDVKRLADYAHENNIQSIAFDNYTGFFATKYYNIPAKHISVNDTNYKGYLALSASVIVYNSSQKQTYSWVIDHHKPIFRAGQSIFVYKIE
jgi:hypothetical protein